jgi:ribonuclease P protein component
MLPLRFRLNARQFKTIYNSGEKYRGEFGMLVVKRDLAVSNPKFGFVVSKKIGNAPTRHRMTRLLRNISMEIIKEYGLQEKPYLCQYIAFKFTDSYSVLKEEYGKQILKAFEVNEEDRVISN